MNGASGASLFHGTKSDEFGVQLASGAKRDADGTRLEFIATSLVYAA